MTGEWEAAEVGGSVMLREGGVFDALERAREHLRSLQDPGGWWKGELETNVTMDAEDIMLREFLGIREAAATERSAVWIRSKQREDGSWANFYDGPGELSTTIEAYVALRLAGDSPDAAHMRTAAAFVRSTGGIEQARVFTHIWLALFGAWPWSAVPELPPELMLLPPKAPVSVYDFACWARQTVVALSIVLAERPTRSFPFSLDELHGAKPWQRPRGSTATSRALAAADRAFAVYRRVALGPVRRAALARAERWIIRRQEADGSWGGIQPPWVYSLIALSVRGYPIEHPVMATGLEGLDRFTIEDGDSRRLEACQSPIWDTALAMVALADAGVEGDDEAMIRAAGWLLDEQVQLTGDWAVRRPGLAPGGWSFEFANDYYPDVDDTAEVVLALLRAEHPDGERLRRALTRATEWLEGMQDSDGGWGAFDAANTKRIMREIPFCDFGEVIDPPSADVTAHAVEMLAALGRADSESARRGIAWLTTEQEADGSWFGRWGVNHVYGTGAVVPALVAAGVPVGDERIRRAVRWLEDHQNTDGGWGEDARSYVDPAWIGRGPSTASQTAWALLALHAAGERSLAMRRGVRFLVTSQREDGSWDEPEYTGTGFPGHFYINYHLYRIVFPTMALARCAS
ncbi:MAG TPA: squalene--hopene cyclase [Solirubrobacteraceae bacterium]|nr:squalene--hopene cyclase [Solirubrobacteraceae bacterium]